MLSVDVLKIRSSAVRPRPKSFPFCLSFPSAITNDFINHRWTQGLKTIEERVDCSAAIDTFFAHSSLHTLNDINSSVIRCTL